MGTVGTAGVKSDSWYCGSTRGYCRVLWVLWVLQELKVTVGTAAVPVGTAGYCGYGGYCGYFRVLWDTAAVPAGTTGYCGYYGYCKKWVLRVLQVLTTGYCRVLQGTA